jgi:hypothetical protein
MLEKYAQQTIFGAAQRHHGLGGVDQETSGRIELPFAEPQDAGLLRRRKVARQHLGPAQYRADSRKQLARGKRLRQIVVRPHLEADDAVRFLAPRRQHQDRNFIRLVCPQVAAEREAVVARHHEVKHDQIDAVAGEHLAHLSAIGHRGDPIAASGKVSVQEFAQLPVVVNDENVVRIPHTHQNTQPARQATYSIL